MRFPKLNDAQISQLAWSCVQRQLKPREIVFGQGTSDNGIFIVLSGSIEIVGVSNGVESVLAILRPGEFTGEVNQLSGRRSLVLCRACESSALLEMDRSNLRHVMQTNAAVGELFLGAFLLRRVFLIANSIGDAILIGSSHSSDTLRLRTFLGRNGHPHTYLEVDVDVDIQTVLDQFSIRVIPPWRPGRAPQRGDENGSIRMRTPQRKCRHGWRHGGDESPRHPTVGSYVIDSSVLINRRFRRTDVPC